mgnify:CR=1 FL=1
MSDEGPQELILTPGPAANGGSCVARHDGRVVFVRHTLPGERVRAVVTEDAGGSFCRADAVDVLVAAPGRVEAPCEYAGPGGCGGCDWQHASPATQRELKRAVVAEQLQLDTPRAPWHTERSRVLKAATSYVQTINACAKFAGDVLLMSEFGETRFGGDPKQQGRGQSSAMAGKRNPAAAVLISIAARQAPGLLATVAACGVQEMERAAGAWQAEWRPLRELVRLLGGTLRESLLLLNDLGIDQERMRENLRAADVGDDVSAAVRRTDEYLARFEAE